MSKIFTEGNYKVKLLFKIKELGRQFIKKITIAILFFYKESVIVLHFRPLQNHDDFFLFGNALFPLWVLSFIRLYFYEFKEI